MTFQVDVLLKGTEHAVTETISAGEHEPGAWTDTDVRDVLKQMLLAIDRVKNPPGDPDRAVTLRGFSWIVSPYEEGGVIIAIEMTMGLAVAGPFDVDKGNLDAMIACVLAGAAWTAGDEPGRVH